MACLISACGLFDKPAPKEDAQTQSAQTAATASATSAAAASSSAAADQAPASYPRHSVAAGKAPTGEWTGAFTVERQVGNEGLSFEHAADFCREQGRALCTETQWHRACVEDPLLGQLETWTLTLEGAQAVVRGGAAGCPARQVVAPTQTKIGRVAACCDRAVAITTTNSNESFLMSSAKHLLDYEAAARRASARKLRDLLDDQVIHYGKERKAEQVVQAFERSSASDWLALDTCEVGIDRDGPETRLVSDCRVLVHRGGAFSSEELRLVHGGPQSKLQLIGKEADMALLGAEKKERVRSFLGGD